jgi:hypothetical protein
LAEKKHLTFAIVWLSTSVPQVSKMPTPSQSKVGPSDDPRAGSLTPGTDALMSWERSHLLLLKTPVAEIDDDADKEKLKHMRHEAHKVCFIANPARTVVTVA